MSFYKIFNRGDVDGMSKLFKLIITKSTGDTWEGLMLSRVGW